MGAAFMSAEDLTYFLLRFVLCGLSAVAAGSSLIFAWQARRDGAPWRVAAGGGILLVIAAMLSAYDAVGNVLLHPYDPITLASWLWFFLFDLLLPIWAMLLVSAWRARDKALAELSRLSVTDQLTGALNRRGFSERAVTSIAQARRARRPAALIMFDIDHFKTVNDTFGHSAGDAVLRDVASVLMTAMRPGDLLGRMGGEEFAVFMQDSTEAAGRQIAERLREAVGTDVVHPGAASAKVTVSGGVAALSDRLEAEAALAVALSEADEALYCAKRQGRNRIISKASIVPADRPKIAEPVITID